MGATSHPVEWADGGGGAVPGEVDIERGGIQGFMAKEGLDGEEVGAVFVQVGAEGMPERMAGKPPGCAWGGRRYRSAGPARSALGKDSPWAFRRRTSIV